MLLRAGPHSTGVRPRPHQQVHESHSRMMAQSGSKSLAQKMFTVPRYGTSQMHDSTRTHECQGYCDFRHHCRRRIGDARRGCPRCSGAIHRIGRRLIVRDSACRLRQWRRSDRQRVQPQPHPGRTKRNRCDTKSKPRRMREHRARRSCLRRNRSARQKLVLPTLDTEVRQRDRMGDGSSDEGAVNCVGTPHVRRCRIQHPGQACLLNQRECKFHTLGAAEYGWATT